MAERKELQVWLERNECGASVGIHGADAGLTLLDALMLFDVVVAALFPDDRLKDLAIAMMLSGGFGEFLSQSGLGSSMKIEIPVVKREEK